MKEKQDLEQDLRSLKVHKPSEGFTAMVTAKAVAELQVSNTELPIMKWMPWFFKIGYVSVFLVLAYLVVQFLVMYGIDQEVILILKAIGFLGVAVGAFLMIDRLIRKVIVGRDHGL